LFIQLLRIAFQACRYGFYAALGGPSAQAFPEEERVFDENVPEFQKNT
jgi:hypothetical protein